MLNRHFCISVISFIVFQNLVFAQDWRKGRFLDSADEVRGEFLGISRADLLKLPTRQEGFKFRDLFLAGRLIGFSADNKCLTDWGIVYKPNCQNCNAISGVTLTTGGKRSRHKFSPYSNFDPDDFLFFGTDPMEILFGEKKHKTLVNIVIKGPEVAAQGAIDSYQPKFICVSGDHLRVVGLKSWKEKARFLLQNFSLLYDLHDNESTTKFGYPRAELLKGFSKKIASSIRFLMDPESEGIDRFFVGLKPYQMTEFAAEIVELGRSLGYFNIDEPLKQRVYVNLIDSLPENVKKIVLDQLIDSGFLGFIDFESFKTLVVHENGMLDLRDRSLESLRFSLLQASKSFQPNTFLLLMYYSYLKSADINRKNQDLIKTIKLYHSIYTSTEGDDLLGQVKRANQFIRSISGSAPLIRYGMSKEIRLMKVEALSKLESLIFYQREKYSRELEELRDFIRAMVSKLNDQPHFILGENYVDLPKLDYSNIAKNYWTALQSTAEISSEDIAIRKFFIEHQIGILKTALEGRERVVEKVKSFELSSEASFSAIAGQIDPLLIEFPESLSTLLPLYERLSINSGLLSNSDLKEFIEIVQSEIDSLKDFLKHVKKLTK